MATGVKLPGNRHIFFGVFALLAVSLFLGPVEALQERDRRPITLGGKTYVPQDYVVKKGEWISKILRQECSPRESDLPRLLAVVRKLNRSLRDPDLIQPGDRIVILRQVNPDPGSLAGKQPQEEKTLLHPVRKEPKYEEYTVRRGDWLSKIAHTRYGITLAVFFNQYLGLFKESNPSLKDPNRIYPGQVIRLPLYPPQFAKRPVKPILLSRPVETSPLEGPPVTAKLFGPKIPPGPKAPTLTPGPVTPVNPAVYHLGRIFSEMGEEWVQSGEHFIPLKSGSGVHFKVPSFPMVYVRNGRWVIVDPRNGFPEEIASLIGSTWGHYRVVHLREEDDLRSALDRVLKACGYPKVYKKGEPLELGGDIGLRITGDWIVALAEPGSDKDPGFILINLIESHRPRTPQTIKDYLARVGVKAIEYPPVRGNAPADTCRIEKTAAGPDRSSLVETLLTLMGYPFSPRAKVHVYQNREGDLKFIVTADYYLRVKDRNVIIDLSGMSPAFKSLLEDHAFLVLELATVKDRLDVVVNILQFFGVRFRPGPLSFSATARDESKNIRITLPGVVFSDHQGRPVLATPLDLPDNIAAFLGRKGYGYLTLSTSPVPLSEKGDPVVLTRQAPGGSQVAREKTKK